MKNAIAVSLYLTLILGGCSDQTKADDKGYQEFDTAYAHCVLVKDGGYNGNSPALSCVPNGKVL
jgi:uncharacterized protein YceK